MMCQKMFTAVFTALLMTSVAIEALEFGICEGTEGTLHCEIGTIEVTNVLIFLHFNFLITYSTHTPPKIGKLADNIEQ